MNGENKLKNEDINNISNSPAFEDNRDKIGSSSKDACYKKDPDKIIRSEKDESCYSDRDINIMFNQRKATNNLLFHKFIMINEILDKRNKKQNPEMQTITKGQGRLIILLKRKDRISTKALSEILNISVSSLNETLNKLEQKNFIRKVPSEKDKRVLLVELTEEGRKLEIKNHEDIDIFDSLDDDEKEILNEYLNRLTISIHNKFKKENPEKYEKIMKNRKEIFEKYFKDTDYNDEWREMLK